MIISKFVSKYGLDKLKNEFCIAEKIIILNSKRFAREFRTTAFLKLEDKNEDSHQPKGKPISEIPGPKALPLIGTEWIYSIFGPYSKNSAPTTAREGLLQKYGTIYKEKLGGAWIVSVHNVKDIELVLRSQGKSPIRVPTQSVIKFRKSRPDMYSNVGLVEEVGETWAKLRKKVSDEVLKMERVRNYIELLSPIADDFCRNVRTLRNPQTNEIEDIRDLLYGFGLEAIWISALGKKIGAMDNPPSKEARYMFENAIGFLKTIAALTLSLPYWKYFPSKTYKQQCMHDENLHRTITEYTRAAREEFDSKPSDYEHEDTIFNNFYKTKDFDIKDINVIITDFITAGIPTTSYFFCIFLHRLAKEPELIERLRREVLTVVPSDGVVTKESLQQLHLLRATMNEGFRICGIAPLLLKILPVDVVLQGFHLPKYTPIFCQTRVSGMHASNFTDPLAMIPERWMQSTNEIRKRYPNHEELSAELKSNRFLIVPFGFGPRSCVGRRLAEQEIMVLLIKILLNFNLHSEGELELGDQLVIAPVEKVTIRFTDLVNK